MWTPVEDRMVLDLWVDNPPWRIAARLGRTSYAVRERYAKIKRGEVDMPEVDDGRTQ
jgi:hypothetical protein